MSEHDAPLVDVACRLRDGELTPRSYVDDLLDRVDEREAEVRALVPEEGRAERLRREAAELETRYDADDRPPLYGVPVGVKDIFNADGFETRAGSEVPPEELVGEEASSVTALREAGALVLGKTVTTEFAYAEPGPTRNPHDPNHTPGGSSSGSAAAVAAGMTPLALGTQTVGSVVRPAAFCGVVGFKPTFGRIDRDGVVPFAESFDHVGTFTRTVADAQLAGSLLCDRWVDVDPPDSPVLGVPEGPYLERASEEGRAAFRDHVGALENAGYEIRRVDAFEDFEAMEARHSQLKAAEFALVHHELFERYGDRYRPQTVDLVHEGRTATVAEMGEARAEQKQSRRALVESMDDHAIDVWLSPAAPGPAPADLDTTGDAVMNLPWTHTGMPSVTVPAGRAQNGLPLGLQCVARPGRDERLLSWAGTFDAELPAV